MNSTTKLLVFTNYANSWSQNSWDSVFLSLPLDPVSMVNTVTHFINDFFGSNVKSLNFPVKNSYLNYLKQSHCWCFWLLTLCAAPTVLVFNCENKSYIINLALLFWDSSTHVILSPRINVSSSGSNLENTSKILILMYMIWNLDKTKPLLSFLGHDEIRNFSTFLINANP